MNTHCRGRGKGWLEGDRGVGAAWYFVCERGSQPVRKRSIREREQREGVTYM
jgi:hypothetical protein